MNIFKYMRFLMIVLVLCVGVMGVAGCALPTTGSQPITPVNVQLKWVHQAQFAGFYVAAAEGYYTEEGVDITLTPGGAGVDILDEVTSGRAQFGVISADKLIIARSQGMPVRAIATTYRRNPFVLVSMPESGITRPSDLAGHTVGLGGNDGLVQFAAMMTKLNLDISQVKVVPYVFGAEPLYSGEVDMIPAFAAGSLMGILKQHPDVNLIWPEDYGIHFYSDTIFTTDQLIADNPALVLAFLRATLKGHDFAIRDPQAATQVSLKYATDADPDVQKEMMTASIPLINTGEDQIGWMKADVWAAMEKTLSDQGLLASPLDVTDVYTIQFLQEIYQ
jgi:NitT/TauT family transport system substrate-binding protein